MAEAQIEQLRFRREHPQCLWANWFDAEGCGPIGLDGCDIQVEWQMTCLGSYVCIAGGLLGGLYFRSEDARELAARLLKAADLAEAAATGTDATGIVWSG